MAYLSLHKFRYSSGASLESRLDAGVYKTEGIILKKADLAEHDRLLTVYTKKFGKILVRAKGIGKRQSKLRSLIEPFNLYEFLLAKSKTIDVLAGVWPIKEFVNLRQNLESLALAFYFAELVDKLVVAPEPDEKIWALLIRVLELLNNPPCSSLKLRGGDGGVNIKTDFEEKLLEFLGHPSFAMHGQVEIGQRHAQHGGKAEQRQKQNYLESLAGEEIKSEEFLKNLALI